MFSGSFPPIHNIRFCKNIRLCLVLDQFSLHCYIIGLSNSYMLLQNHLNYNQFSFFPFLLVFQWNGIADLFYLLKFYYWLINWKFIKESQSESYGWQNTANKLVSSSEIKQSDRSTPCRSREEKNKMYSQKVNSSDYTHRSLLLFPTLCVCYFLRVFILWLNELSVVLGWWQRHGKTILMKNQNLNFIFLINLLFLWLPEMKFVN